MMSTLKKNLYPVLLSCIFFSLVVDVLLRILWGYTAGDILLYMLRYLVLGIRYSLIVVCLIVSVRSIFKRKRYFVFSSMWIFFAILSIVVERIPQAPFETFGGMLSAYYAGPGQILVEAQTIADTYPPMTCIGASQQRFPCDHPITPGVLPDALQRLHVRNVLVLEDYVLMEKFGLGGVFRGFVAFKQDSDIWANEKFISVQPGCRYCWRIRIIQGLYWYYANPFDPPIFISPLK